MASDDHYESRASKIGRSIFLRRAARQRGFIVVSLISGFVLVLPTVSCLTRPTNGPWRTLFAAASTAQAWLYGMDRAERFRIGRPAPSWVSPHAVAARRQAVVRALMMTAALIAVGFALQFLLYAEPYHLSWLTRPWLTTNLPRIVALGFGTSLVIGVVVETRRLIGGALLTSVLLGTHHRPSRQRRIVMFLDIANSTRLAEAMGELRVHDLTTRFFFDIDEPISDYRGTVHAYVGDEVIVTWPVTGDPVRNARSVACFFAIRRKMSGLAPDYEAEFGVAPEFRAGMHAGVVVVSECGDAKRQLAYFGDTMNVGARLCEYCKTINEQPGDFGRLADAA